ncbi:MAG: hypothetical protein AAF063_30680 [Cyanobacteria bacterium J06643_5]
MNNKTKAKLSLFALAISTIAAPFVISNAPAFSLNRRTCEARFLINGKVVQEWTDLGRVGGTSRQKRCKRRGKRHAISKITYRQIGLTPEQVCKKFGAAGGATIYIDTRLRGKPQSQDGSVKTWLGLKDCTPRCTYRPQFKSTSRGGSSDTSPGGGSEAPVRILENDRYMK